MSNLLEELGLTREELIDRLMDKILEIPSGARQTGVDPESYVALSIFDEIKKRVGEYAEYVVKASDKRITELIDDAVRGELDKVFNSTYQPVDRFGHAIGKPTSIRDMICKEAGVYWSTKVDISTGRELGEYAQGGVTRAEYSAKQAVKNFYGEEMHGIADEIKKRIPEKFSEQVVADFASRLFR